MTLVERLQEAKMQIYARCPIQQMWSFSLRELPENWEVQGHEGVLERQ